MMRFQGTGLLIALTLLASGCGKPPGPATYTVTGTVTFESAPVTLGTVNFYEEATGKAGQASLGEGGTYSVNLEAGKYQVSISPPFETEVQSVNTPREGEYMKVDNIPMKYRGEATSGFVAEVAVGKTSFDFAMKK